MVQILRLIGLGLLVRMKSLYQFCVFIMASIFLIGCETLPVQKPLPVISFTGVTPILLDVAQIEIHKNHKPPLRLSNVDHEMPLNLQYATQSWAKQRFKAVGHTGMARFIIMQASVVETKQKKTKGIKGVFTTDQGERYDGTLSVRVEVFGGIARGTAAARAVVRASRTISEDATLAERERKWYDMTEAMVNELDKTLESQISRHLKAFLKETP